MSAGLWFLTGVVIFFMASILISVIAGIIYINIEDKKKNKKK